MSSDRGGGGPFQGLRKKLSKGKMRLPLPSTTASSSNESFTSGPPPAGLPQTERRDPQAYVFPPSSPPTGRYANEVAMRAPFHYPPSGNPAIPSMDFGPQPQPQRRPLPQSQQNAIIAASQRNAYRQNFAGFDWNTGQDESQQQNLGDQQRLASEGRQQESSGSAARYPGPPTNSHLRQKFSIGRERIGKTGSCRTHSEMTERKRRIHGL